MIIDGRKMASEIFSRVKTRAGELSFVPRVLAISVGGNPATNSYLKIKQQKAVEAGCILEVRKFGEDVTLEELKETILSSSANSIIVQLPLPKNLDPQTVCDLIPLSKDVDILSSISREMFEKMGDLYIPPVVGAVKEILDSQEISVKDKKVVVIGKGFLVGAPVTHWLNKNGALVEIATIESENLAEMTIDADIIISGAGVPNLIKPEMIKNGVVLIDAGTSESSGKVVGDADPLCAEKCSLFTSVPGGVGPVAVAKLFENVVQLAENEGL